MIIERADRGLREPPPMPGKRRARRLHQFWLAASFAALFLISTGATAAQQNDTPDYSQVEHWLALPSSPDKQVDVFYLYPTAYQKGDPSAANISDIDSPSMVTGAQSAFARQATAFEPVGNIYAPYYRQADAMYTLNLPLDEQAKVVGGIPATDVRAAFEYYIDNYNNGRPFILAGHSQGSNVLLYLLSGYMRENPAVYRRMIAAYVIGYSVTPEYLSDNPYLKFADRADDVGVIVSYNTEAPNVSAKNPVLLADTLVINPISWTRTDEVAPASESLGSILYDDSGSLVTVEHYADARIDTSRGVVVCSTCDVERLAPGGNQGFPRGVFHSYDYLFYYYDIRANAISRVDQFLNRATAPN